MPQTIQQVMTKNPITLPHTATAYDAAVAMKGADIGDVIVLEDETPCGIVTDRDIVVRAIAEEKMPNETKLGEICSKDLFTLQPSSPVAEAVKAMREKALRRVPVIENGTAVGIVSIGDLAVERDEDSALADISEAPPQS